MRAPAKPRSSCAGTPRESTAWPSPRPTAAGSPPLSDDATVRLWDTAAGQEILALRAHADQVTGVAFGPDGRTIAASSKDHTLTIWDSKPMTVELREFRKASALVESLFASSLTRPLALDLILKDATISEPVRLRALALVKPFDQSLALHEAERVKSARLFQKPMLQPDVLSSLRHEKTLTEPVRRRGPGHCRRDAGIPRHPL